MIAVLQLPLFPDLPEKAAAKPAQRGRTWREAVRVLLALKQRLTQIPLCIVLRKLERDIDTAFDFPRQAVTTAAAAPVPETTAAPSIWALAASIKELRMRGRFGDAAGFEVPRYGVTIREAGVTRHIARRFEETPEWAEQERARRARQKPPRPPKGAKTRGKKVREWDGEGVDG